MSPDETKERLAEIEAPYNRQVWLDDVKFDSGMQLLRVTIREGRRITQLDIDPETAAQWGETLLKWSEKSKTVDS